jgi:hypothetical protein
VSPFLPDLILTALQQIGDPTVDPKFGGRSETQITDDRDAGLSALADLKALRPLAATAGLTDRLRAPAPPPDPAKIQTACDVFARYGSEIGAALLLAGLPEAYAARRGAQLLFSRSPLADGGLPMTRRIAATAQFIIATMTPDASLSPIDYAGGKYRSLDSQATKQLWGKNGQALRYTIALRILHALIRHQKGTGKQQGADPMVFDGAVPLNQEDLLAMLLTFSITVFEVLEQFGIALPPDEEASYFYAWNHIGDVLGIGGVDVIGKLLGQVGPSNLEAAARVVRQADKGTRTGNASVDTLLEDPFCREALRTAIRNGSLRPQSVAEGRALLDRLRSRLWTLSKDTGWPPYGYMNFDAILDDVEAGRVLLRALLDEMATALTPSQKAWPVALMRQLLAPKVLDRLALGGQAVPDSVVSELLQRSGRLGGDAFGRLPAEVLRRWSTQVCDALFLKYMTAGTIQIFGLEADALGLS